MDKIENTKLFIFDMDGTIYLSDTLINGSLELIEKLDNRNTDYIFLTNNSSKNINDYKKKLTKLGINVDLDHIVSSGEVTASHIKDIKNENENDVYVVGTKSLEKVFKNYGFNIVDNRNENVDYLVLGFDTTLTYKKLWDAHYLINKGVKYYATNPDKVCPLENNKSMPDCGAIINLLKTSTNKEPMVVGKPNELMVKYIAKKFSVERKYISMVGDRLYTDIKMAEVSGINSILVLSGETDRADLVDSTIKPDFVVESVKDLNKLI